jgi:uncharacterized membrane protein
LVLKYKTLNLHQIKANYRQSLTLGEKSSGVILFRACPVSRLFKTFFDFNCIYLIRIEFLFCIHIYIQINYLLMNNRLNKFAIFNLSFLIFCAIMFACSNNDEPDLFLCDDVVTSYSANIKSIIDSNCAISACHTGSTGQIDLSTFLNVSSQAQRIKTRVVNRTMPPPSRPKLSEEQIKQIACWVDAGAPEN